MPAQIQGKNYASPTPQAEDIRSIFGALAGMDWRQQFIARGYGWHFDVGAFSTPIVGGGAGTIIDQDQPEFGIGIPTDWVFVPLRVHVQCQTGLSAADNDENEILIAADVAAVAAGLNSTNGTVETPTNMRSNAGTGCPFTVASALTMNITNPTLGVELARKVKVTDYVGTPANALLNDLDLLYEPKWPDMIVGPAGVYGYWGGTVAVSGFAQVEFLAIPKDLLPARA